MGLFTPLYSSPYARLAANVIEDGDCWLGTERTRDRGGYVQVNFRVPGLGGKIVKFSAHRLAWIAFETGFTSMDDLYLAYLEFRYSGLVIDHLCEVPSCRRPSHLEPVTHSENCKRKYNRVPISVSSEPETLEF